MAEVFNQNPSAYVDMNTLFPVLNDKVGLTSTQWQKAIENANYLYNHLGLADVSVGLIETVFTAPGTLSNVTVVHREVTVGDKTTDYFDFTFYIPTPKIETELTSELVDNIEEVGIGITQEPIYGQGLLSKIIIGYKFKFDSKIYNPKNVVTSVNDKTGDVVLGAEDIGALRESFVEDGAIYKLIHDKYGFEIRREEERTSGVGGTIVSSARIDFDGFTFVGTPKINGQEMAYKSDLESAIGDINTILDAINGEVI